MEFLEFLIFVYIFVLRMIGLDGFVGGLCGILFVESLIVRTEVLHVIGGNICWVQYLFDA